MPEGKSFHKEIKHGWVIQYYFEHRVFGDQYDHYPSDKDILDFFTEHQFTPDIPVVIVPCVWYEWVENNE